MRQPKDHKSAPAMSQPHCPIERLEPRRLLSSATAAAAPVVPVPLQPSPANSPAASIHGLTPTQVRRDNGLDRIMFGSTRGDGAGQTIAVVTVDDDPNVAADLAAFDKAYGIAAPASFHVVNQHGGTSLPPADAEWAMRTALDVEWAHAIAPGAGLLVVEAGSASLSSVAQAVNIARHAPGVSVVTILGNAIGLSSSNPAGGNDPLTTPAGHGGVTFVAALSTATSGTTPAPSWPTSSPSVLTIGDVDHSPAASPPRRSNDSSSTPAPGPSTPDVIDEADLTRGLMVFDSVPLNGHAGWWSVHGPAGGAPQWAGLIAIANQGRALRGLAALDGATGTVPDIYAMALAAFRNGGQPPPPGVRHSNQGGDGNPASGAPDPVSIIQALVGAPATSNSGGTGTPDVQRSPRPGTAPGPAVTPLSLAPARDAVAGASNASASAGIRSSTVANAGGSPAAGSVAVASPPTNFVSALPSPRGATLAPPDGPDEAPAGAGGGVAAILPAAAGALRPAAATTVVQAAQLMTGDAAGAASLAASSFYGFVHLSADGLVPQAMTDFVRDWASLPPASFEVSPRAAWLVTAAVIAADAVLVAAWYQRQRRGAGVVRPDPYAAASAHVERFADRIL